MCCNGTCSGGNGMGGIGRSGPSSGAYSNKHALFAFRSRRNAVCQKWQWPFSTSMDGDGSIMCWQLAEAEKRMYGGHVRPK